MACFGLVAGALCLGLVVQEPPKVVTVTVCPVLRPWSTEEQKQVGVELRTMQQGGATKRAIRDFVNLRDQVRECQKKQ